MRKKHIFITGCSGFVGKHLQRNLVLQGYKISVVSRYNANILNLPVNFYQVDLADKLKLSELIYYLKPDYVFHLAANKDRSQNIETFRSIYDNNLSISLNLIEACCKLPNLKKFIFMGSSDEYGFSSKPYYENCIELPISSYALSKLSISKILMGLYYTNRFPSLILRPSVIYGPEQSDEMFIPSLINSLIHGRNFSMTLGEQYRDFVYVDDVISALNKALLSDESVNGNIFNIGYGTSYKIKYIAEIISAAIGINSYEKIKFGAINYKLNEIMDYSVNVDLAKKVLNWQAKIGISEGIQNTINFFKHSYVSRS